MNLKRIVDEAVYQDKMVFGNINDRVNLINQVDPSADVSKYDDLWDKLAEAGVEESDKLFFVLGNEEIEKAILNYPVKGMILSFRKA